MTANRNYEVLNTGIRLNAYDIIYRCTALFCITIYSLPDFKKH